MGVRKKKVLLLGTFFFSSFIVVFHSNYSFQPRDFVSEIGDLHKIIVEDFYKKRESWNTSNLGAILFKNAAPEMFMDDRANRTFVILIWRYWNWLKKRHSNKDGDPSNLLNHCSVQNCVFIYDDEKINEVDAVIIHTQKGALPHVEQRNLSTRWIFLNDESPKNMFSLAIRNKKPNIGDFDGFNWTMLYRSDSDIPVPYGRTVPLPIPLKVDFTEPQALEALVPYWKLKTERKVAIILSNCLKFRMAFIDALETNGIQVDIFGKCANGTENKNKCPGHYHSDCMLPSKYIFYLVIENSKCHEYITEKVFHHAYSKGAIPIIMGPPPTDCKRLLPPSSYIHVSDFKSVKQLVNYLHQVLESDSVILRFHTWRRHFEVVNEHGYFSSQSHHLCRVCEAMNYNDRRPKVYSERDLKAYLDFDSLCDDQYGWQF